MAIRQLSLLLLTALFAAAPATAQTGSDSFRDRDDGAKAHVSGFVCPHRIGDFERDAVGEYDLEKNQDFCAYAARDAVYGTITLAPLSGGFDPKAAFADEFRGQESTGGKRLSEFTVHLNGSPLPIYTRTYRTAQAEALEYRIVFAGAAVRNWVVQATVEYADPRDTQTEAEFLRAVFAAAERQIGSR
ncbi:MAG: hypothetical protein JO056_01075 [Alphaproteobacteria bacterium]|nr:hypothetical protein [Alphaproteobacteria bacterium]